MKLLSRILVACLYTVTVIVLIASVGSAITQKPLLMTAIRSNSMYPLLERGDMVYIKNLSPDSPLKNGDIIAFTTQNGSLASQGLIMHRIVGGNEIDGYITKGDANDYTDQESGGTGPIKREWITSKVPTIGKYPLKIPLLGYLPLWMENFKTNSYTLPGIALFLAIIIGISELVEGRKKRKKKKSKLELQLIYFFSGLTITIMLSASMLAASQHLSLSYEVSETSQGVIMGSNVGILKVGEEVQRPLSDLSNKGFFPITATITSKDKQLSFSHESLSLSPGEEIKVTMDVKATTPGKYNSTIWVGMFFPFLPKSLIYWLSQQSFWLALFVVSLIPGLPVMLYPLIDSHLRRKTLKELRRLRQKAFI